MTIPDRELNLFIFVPDASIYRTGEPYMGGIIFATDTRTNHLLVTYETIEERKEAEKLLPPNVK